MRPPRLLLPAILEVAMGGDIDAGRVSLPATIQESAWSSPIWIVPGS